MRVIVSAGGTGGHLYPALALVDYIKTQDSHAEFLFVGTTDRLESKVVPELGYAYKGLHVKGLVGNPFQKLKNVAIFIKSLSTSKKILKEFKPDIVVGFGGYPSASILMAASRLHIPTMIHEQNSIIGLTNKILINKVDEIICCYDSALKAFPQDKTKKLGNPRASKVWENNLKNVHDLYDIPASQKVVVIVMGSLGSASVNNTMKEALALMQNKDYDVLYATGKTHYDDMKDMCKDLASNIHIVPYIDDMPSVLSSSDVIVSRAGATTIAEMLSLGSATILIPSPYVVANHQELNALELTQKEAAIMIKEKDLNTRSLVSEIESLIHDDEKRNRLKENAKALGTPHACEDIYKEMKTLLGRK